MLHLRGRDTPTATDVADVMMWDLGYKDVKSRSVGKIMSALHIKAGRSKNTRRRAYDEALMKKLLKKYVTQEDQEWYEETKGTPLNADTRNEKNSEQSRWGERIGDISDMR